MKTIWSKIMIASLWFSILAMIFLFPPSFTIEYLLWATGGLCIVGFFEMADMLPEKKRKVTKGR